MLSFCYFMCCLAVYNHLGHTSTRPLGGASHVTLRRARYRLADYLSAAYHIIINYTFSIIQIISGISVAARGSLELNNYFTYDSFWNNQYSTIVIRDLSRNRMFNRRFQITLSYKN